MKRFAHLHVHSEYSLLDGANRIVLQEHHRKSQDPRVKSLVRQVKALGMSSVALTDHGNMCGAVEFYREARTQGVKAILGMEAYIAPAGRHERSSKMGEGARHLTLLAKDEQGYRNLMRLASLGHEEGFHYRPRIDRELLEKYQEGLIALSGCLKGELAELVLKGKSQEAAELAGRYKELFGPNRYFVELMDHGIPEERQVIRELVGIAKDNGLKTVATNDAHYMEKDDALAHDVMLCIQTGKTLEDQNRMRFQTQEFYLKSAEEMAKLFSELPDAVERSWEISEHCGLELVFADDKGGKLHFPSYPIPEGFASADDCLRHLCMEGVKNRYGEMRGEVIDRLDHELKVISHKGFATYFLIVSDIVRYAKEKGILVGPGRGSAAGSLVAFVLAITELDPLKFGLIFERFLNPSREEPPDIDIDFPDGRRDEVVEYVKRKYGSENVAQIVTFARMNARAVVRDVGRVMGFPYGEVDRLAKMIPGGPSSSLAQGLETEEIKAAVSQKGEYGKLFSVARALESCARHASTHAAGIVIAPASATRAGGLRDFVPLLKLEGDQLVTQFDMDGIKYLGLLKIDLLGLKTLTVLEETRQLVRRTRGVEIDYNSLSLEDPQTYSIFSEGRTDGIFQFESSGMRDALRKLKPDRLEDLIALNALYRPGPMEQIDPYIRRHRGVEPPHYDVPELEPILKETYGIVVFQEQVLRIVHELAGYDMTKADNFRRSMGRKIAEIMEREEKSFVEGATAKGIPKDKAERIFDFLEKFAGYGFNRSHSAAYALLAYWTAYLKTHYPVEFMAALLTSETGNQDKIAEYVAECRKLKLLVLPPDVNASLPGFSVESMPAAGGEASGKPGQAVRFGLTAVKNVGQAASDLVVKAREQGGPFKSFSDFCERVDCGVVNRKALESLIKCGALGALGRREQLLAAMPQMLDRVNRRQNERATGQESLFDPAALDGPDELPEVDETPGRNNLAYEKEFLGCYVSGHPLAEYEQELGQFATQSLKPEKLENLNGSCAIKVAGVVSHLRRGTTKKKEPYARFQIEDLEGTVEALAWPEIIRKSGEHLGNGAILMVSGTLQRQDEGRPTLIVKELMPLDEAQVRLTRGVHLAISAAGTDQGVLKSLREIASLSPGAASLYLHIKTLHHGEAVLEADPSLRVKPTRELISQFKAILGEEAVSLTDKQYLPA